MRKVFILISFAILFMGLFSCNDKTSNDPGNIMMKALLKDGSPAVNAKLSIATSQENLNRGSFYIEDASSDLEGNISIYDVAPRVYYWECVTVNYNKDNYYSSGSLEVLPGQTTNIQITLEKL